MSVKPTYPGVYIEEVPSGVRTITGVATSITGFIGRVLRGPVNKPVRIQSFAEFERIFGGLWLDSTMSYSIRHFFDNGGKDAIVLRIHRDAQTAEFNLASESGQENWSFEASSPGSWGNNLFIRIDHDTENSTDSDLFNMFVSELKPKTNPLKVVNSETFRNISTNGNSPRHVIKVIEQNSELLKLKKPIPTSRPSKIGTLVDLNGIDKVNNDWATRVDAVDDGINLTSAEYIGSENDKTGLYAFKDVDILNILVIPPSTFEDDIETAVWNKALNLCYEERMMLIVDPPFKWTKPSDVTASDAITNLVIRNENAALFFPHVYVPDPLKEYRLQKFTPSGLIAGVWARTDSERGVWKAPAGQDAVMKGVGKLSYKLTDGENGQLNPLGVNCCRTFPIVGNVVWGARTLKGADQLTSEWKYIPVRRTALFIEESLYLGLKWVVFEPNDEPLWSQIRLNVGAFMHNLFRQGAFQGTTPKEAYLVKCDKETTTQNDINNGIVNILVGFAPLKPAEFVFIKIQQLAGQIET
jgi:phage tail sheath protein FI